MSAPLADQYLDMIGMLHEITWTPTGSAEDPWPLHLEITDGHGRAACLVHREDAETLISYLTARLAETASS